MTPGLVDQNGYWTIFFRPLGDINWIRYGAAVPKHETKAELEPPYAEG